MELNSTLLTRLLPALLVVLWNRPTAAQAIDKNELTTEFYGMSVTGRVGGLVYGGMTQGFAASDDDFNSYQAAAVATFRLIPRPLYGWVGFLYRFTNSHSSTDQHEYRPFGVLFAGTDPTLAVRLSLLSRAEYLIKTASDGSALDDYWRLRSRVGFDFPIGKTAWEKGSFYGLADIEPLFELRSETSSVDELRIRFGLGYLITERWIVEAIWTLSLHSTNSEPLAWDRNMFRFRAKYRWEELGRLVAAGFDF